MKAAARAFLVLFSAVALFGCGRKPVTYDLTITNPFADVSGVTATIEVESGKTEVPISGATKTIPVVVPEIKESDAMQQLLLVTLHAAPLRQDRPPARHPMGESERGHRPDGQEGASARERSSRSAAEAVRREIVVVTGRCGDRRTRGTSGRGRHGPSPSARSRGVPGSR